MIKISDEYVTDRKQHLRPSGANAAVYGLNSAMVVLCTPPS